MKNFAYLVLALFIASCGNPVLKDFKAQPVTEDDDSVAVELSSKFNVGGMAFANLQIPINHPKKGYEIGVLTLNGSTVGLKINLSEIAPLQSVAGTLPNGSVIPFVGSDEVVAISIGKGIFVYASWVENDVVLGFSVPIKALDSIGQKVGNINLIPQFNINNFEGAAGMYFSKNSGDNGIALFANLGGLFKQNQLEEMYLATDRSYMLHESLNQSLKVYGDSPSSRTEKKIAEGIQALSRKRTRLSVQ